MVRGGLPAPPPPAGGGARLVCQSCVAMAQKNRRLTKHDLRMSKAWIRDGTLSFDILRFALEDGIDEVRGRSVNDKVLGRSGATKCGPRTGRTLRRRALSHTSSDTLRRTASSDRRGRDNPGLARMASTCEHGVTLSPLARLRVNAIRSGYSAVPPEDDEVDGRFLNGGRRAPSKWR